MTPGCVTPSRHGPKMAFRRAPPSTAMAHDSCHKLVDRHPSRAAPLLGHFRRDSSPSSPSFSGAEGIPVAAALRPTPVRRRAAFGRAPREAGSPAVSRRLLAAETRHQTRPVIATRNEIQCLCRKGILQMDATARDRTARRGARGKPGAAGGRRLCPSGENPHGSTGGGRRSPMRSAGSGEPRPRPASRRDARTL